MTSAHTRGAYHRNVRPKAVRPTQMHPNVRTNDYLHSLARGAAVVDPGDLDGDTETELEQRTARGELRREWNHGRRTWKQA